MTSIFAELEVNPFEDDVVTEPRRVSFSVEGLNAKPLERLITQFRSLTKGNLPRQPIVDQKAQLVVSPDRGYGKSHLLGRLFQAVGDQATLIYVRPFQDPQRVWTSILLTTVQELERSNQDGVESQLEAFSKGVLAHVTADHMSDGPVKNQPLVQDAVKDLRANPLTMLGHTPKSKVLINWMKTKLQDQSEIRKLASLLKSRHVELEGREAAWLRVLAGYAFTKADGQERDAALKWLRAEPLEEEEVKTLKLAAADNNARADSSAQEINELSRSRLKGLCVLASYYRPFVFCFDQTEFYGGNRALVDAFGRCIWDLHASFSNHLTIVTANATNWLQEVLPFMQPAYRDRFSAEINLEGINVDQAKELISKRLRDFQVDDAAALDFMGEGWLDAQFGSFAQLGVRDLLMRAAGRFRSLAAPSAKPPPRTSLDDLYAIEVNKIRANKALQRYSQDCLMWFVQVLAEGYEGVTVNKTDQRYFTVRWAWPDWSVYFAFEGGDHNARWRAIARDAIELGGPSRVAEAIVFRTPDLNAIPRPTWGAAKTVIEDAQRKGLRVAQLAVDEVCQLHAARELYSNALQGNINYVGADVLSWLKVHFEPWLKRYSGPRAERSPSVDEVVPIRVVPSARSRKRLAAPAGSMARELTKAQVGTVVEFVSAKKLVDINEVLKTLGDDSLKDGVLRAVENSPNLKAHPCPQTIYLQWRVA